VAPSEDYSVFAVSLNIVIPGRAKREARIHTPGALGPWAIRAIDNRAARALFFRECGKPHARGGYGFRACAWRRIPE
jgi:hypothetical protein